MYCQQCGAEYTEGITLCPSCGVALTNEPPPVPDFEGLTPVLETEDGSLAQVAGTLLEVEGIPFFTASDNVQDILGDGRFTPGFQLVMGPMKLLVAEEHAERAREVLAELPGQVVEEAAPEAS